VIGIVKVIVFVAPPEIVSTPVSITLSVRINVGRSVLPVGPIEPGFNAVVLVLTRLQIIHFQVH
jgi:hypothetical protein